MKPGEYFDHPVAVLIGRGGYERVIGIPEPPPRQYEIAIPQRLTVTEPDDPQGFETQRHVLYLAPEQREKLNDLLIREFSFCRGGVARTDGTVTGGSTRAEVFKSLYFLCVGVPPMTAEPRAPVEEVEQIIADIDAWCQDVRDDPPNEFICELRGRLAALRAQPSPAKWTERAEDIAGERENYGFDNYVALIESALTDAYQRGRAEVGAQAVALYPSPERAAIVAYIRGCREDDTDRPRVQVFDVMANQIEQGKHLPLPPAGDAPKATV